MIDIIGLTKKVVERLCEGGTTEVISLNGTNLCYGWLHFISNERPF
jgi:hypothetical protein